MSVQATAVPPEMQLYTVDEVTAILKYGRSTIFELIRSGRLGSVKEGRVRRIPGTAIIEYLQLLEREAEAA